MSGIVLKANATLRAPDPGAFLLELVFGGGRDGRLSRTEFIAATFVSLALYGFATLVLTGVLLLVGLIAPDGPPLVGATFLYSAVLLMPVYFFASMNAAAKRARHAGLAGWPAAMGLAVLNILFYGDPIMLGAIDASAWLVLATLPRVGA